MEIHPTEDEMEAQIRANAIRPVLLNLYDIEEGFSLTIPGKNCKDSTTETFPYEERELLDCLENGELPWFLADILEHCPAAVYHEGCVAVRICDHRSSSDTSSNGRLIVLRPTFVSLAADLNALLATCSHLSAAQQQELESKFWNMVIPSSTLSAERKRKSQWVPDHEFFRRKSRNCQPYRIMRRKRENDLALERIATLLQLRLAMRESVGQAEDEAVEADLVAQMRQTAEALKTSPVCATSGGQWRPMLSTTKTPLDLAERKAAVEDRKRRERYPEEAEGRESSEMLQLIEEIIVEMPTNASGKSGPVHTTRMLISKHRLTAAYWGQLHLEGHPPVQNGPFLLGVEWDAKMYVLQYLEMITEGGRRQPISVVRNAPGKPPYVMSPKVGGRSAVQQLTPSLNSSSAATTPIDIAATNINISEMNTMYMPPQ